MERHGAFVLHLCSLIDDAINLEDVLGKIEYN
jgi:hypothetical protein